MFSDAEIDVSKRQQRDPLLIQVYNADCNDVFFVYIDVLSAIFSLRGLDRSNTYVELDKKEFMHVLDEAKLLIKPRQKTKEEEKKERETTKKGGAVEQKKVEEVPQVQETLFLEKDVERAIEGVCSFERDQLSFFDFLEAIIRVVDAYPFTNEQRDTMPSFSERLRWFCKSLEDEFGKTVEHMQNR